MPRLPFNAVPPWTELLETKLQKAVLAGQSADPQLITASVDDLSSLSCRTLADAGGSRDRAGRTVGRIDRLEDAQGPSADTDDPTAVINETPSASFMRCIQSKRSLQHPASCLMRCRSTRRHSPRSVAPPPEALQQGPVAPLTSMWYSRSRAATARWSWEHSSST